MVEVSGYFKQFHNRLVVITGRGQGLSLPLTEQLLAAGARVVWVQEENRGEKEPASEKEPAPEEELASEEAFVSHAASALGEKSPCPEEPGGEEGPWKVEADLTDETSIRQVVQEIRQRWGAVDYLLHNANLSIDARGIFELELRELDRLLAVNFRGGLVTIRTFLRDMIEEQKGVVVNVAPSFSLLEGAMQCLSLESLRTVSNMLLPEVEGTGVCLFSLAPASRSGREDSSPEALEHIARQATHLLANACQYHGQFIEASSPPRTSFAAPPPGDGEGKKGPPTGPTEESLLQTAYQIAQVALRLHKGLQKTFQDFDLLNFFKRPRARRNFKQKTGLRVEDWTEQFQRMARGWERLSQSQEGAKTWSEAVALLRSEREARLLLESLVGYLQEAATASPPYKDPARVQRTLKRMNEMKEGVEELSLLLRQMEGLCQPSNPQPET